MTRLDALRNLGLSHIGGNQANQSTLVESGAVFGVELATIDDAFTDALESLLKAQHDLDAVMLQYRHERQRLAGILATFAASPISASSLQPILDLAAEMNKETR